MIRSHGCLAIVATALTVASSASAATLQVGPGKAYATPCAATAAADDGDRIEIAAGTYSGDVCRWAQNSLTIVGVGGRAHLDAAGKNSGGKAIWVIAGKDTVIENIEFSGATVPDQNGAGIRQEGTNLTLRNCYFHDNENGILTGADAASEILIEGCEFASNGFGDGRSHNMYIGQIKKFTLQYSYSHHAKIGHEVKSRAEENHILYNRIMTEADGSGSYEIDLPNGGDAFIIGNLVQQGPKTDNSSLISFAEEGATNSGQALFVVNNTIVNDLGSGKFVVDRATTAAVLRNNIFFGNGMVIDQGGPPPSSRTTSSEIRFSSTAPASTTTSRPARHASTPARTRAPERARRWPRSLSTSTRWANKLAWSWAAPSTSAPMNTGANRPRTPGSWPTAGRIAARSNTTRSPRRRALSGTWRHPRTAGTPRRRRCTAPAADAPVPHRSDAGDVS